MSRQPAMARVEMAPATAQAGCGHPIAVRVHCTAGHEVGPDEIEWRRATAP